MSKIGRKPINIKDIQVTIKDNEITYKGSKGTGSYHLPSELKTHVEGDTLVIEPAQKIEGKDRDLNRIWGLHRALLANELHGAREGFEKKIEIVGLGYKAVQQGNKLVFSLGYSHKIDVDVPQNISIAIDRSGQKLTLTGSDKEKIGKFASKICSLREPEPYKGTGVKIEGQHIVRKEGKTK